MSSVGLMKRLGQGWRMCPVAPGIPELPEWARRPPPEAVEAVVPGIIQQVVPEHHGLAWYWCEWCSPNLDRGERLLLCFEGVDYSATVWVNGGVLGGHEGQDTPFSFDITGVAKPGGANVVAVRVLNPTAERIDGVVLDEVPHANKAARDFWPGQGYNFGGIMGEVSLRVVPEVRLDDVHVVSRLATGEVRAEVQVLNAGGSAWSGKLNLTVSEARSGHRVAHASAVVQCLPGTQEAVLSVTVAHVRPWDLDDPFLYAVVVSLSGDKGDVDHVVKRTGFRELTLEGGFFHLNGRRLYLRSTHTGNHYPLGQKVPPVAAMVRQDLIFAKASGFNTVRFISGLALRDQLDFCDEIGLMVYEEPASAWLLADSPHMAERFQRSVAGMVRRDRNHPSVVIWGLLNETYEGAVFREAVGSLATLRKLDDTRLVLLSSGRWDGDLSVGSVAKPGSAEWQHEWGAESPSASSVEVGWQGDLDRAAYVAGAGDVHLYPRLPESARARGTLQELGVGSKPVFLSEYGVGSVFDAVTEAADAAQSVTGPVPPDLEFIRGMARRFLEDWETFGMGSVYCFPADALRASQEHQSRQRAVSFDRIRANGRIAGYNLTGMLDHALTGEGSWTFWRRWKPGAVEALSEGWAPLRWCLSLEPAVAYPGATVEVDLSLANEDVLGPGTYPVVVAVVGPDGFRWEHNTNVEIGPASQSALAVPALQQGLLAGAVPGAYRCTVSMGMAAAPAAGRATFWVLERPRRLASGVRYFGVGLDGPTREWLKGVGVSAGTNPKGARAGDVVIVAGGREVPERWVTKVTEDGATAVVFKPWEFTSPGAGGELGGLGLDLECRASNDWLYHKECFAKSHEVFAGLPSPGLLDWDFYGGVWPRYVLRGQPPEDVAGVAFALGYPCPGGYLSGVVAGAWRAGRGWLVLNCFDLEGKLGSPVADSLVANMIGYASKLAVAKTRRNWVT